MKKIIKIFVICILAFFIGYYFFNLAYGIGFNKGLETGSNECSKHLINDWAWWDNAWNYKQNINSEYTIYYGKDYTPQESLEDSNKNYNFNGEINIHDSDDLGNCWSYNGSDEPKDLRVINVEGNILLRRCLK